MRFTALCPPLVLALIAVSVPSAALAQSDATRTAAAVPPTPVKVGMAVSRSLDEGTPDVYTLDLESGSFVVGDADQLSVDVVVQVYGPGGESIARFDGPALGPEKFTFDAPEAGTYRIEIAPFEDQSGEYTLTVRRAERIATDPAQRVGQLMAAFSGQDTPGVSVGVVRDGELVFAEAYGMASLTFGVPFEVDTPSNIGSTSKQFTAFAVCLLAQQGELSLDDDVRRHLPELPDLGQTVTLRNLLTHTSGYREFLNLLAMTGRQVQRGDWISRDEIVGLIQRQPELQNEPGAEWNYNNSAFALLTLVVERVSGTPFPEWMDENVFTPLGMDDTVVHTDPTVIIPGRASGYTIGDTGRYVEVSDLGGSMGAGGIYSTIGDLAKWVNNFHTHALGGEEIYAQMTTPFVLNDGKPTEYGLGLFLDELNGLQRVQHGGADLAHRSMLEYFPTINAGVIALSNNSAFTGGDASKVAEAFFADAMTFEDRTTGEASADSIDGGAPTLTPEGYDAVLGRYEFEEMPGFVLTVTRNGDTLYGQATGQPRLSLSPTEGTTFQVAGEQIFVEFMVQDDGSCAAITLHQNGDHVANKIEEEPWAPTAEDLAAYAGRYFSEELETFYTVAVEEGKLVLRQRRFELELRPGDEHEFAGGYPIAEVEFTLDDDGRVSGLLASNGRTRGVRFEKQD